MPLDSSTTVPPLETNERTCFRHGGWRVTRTRILHALQSTEQSTRRISAFQACGKNAFILVDAADSNNVTLSADYCHDRLCKPCQAARGRLIRNNIAAHAERDHRRYRFLTLTQPHSSLPLDDQIESLYRRFKALRRTRFWRRYITGGVAFLEVTYNAERQEWHPHLHAIIEGSYVPGPELTHVWSTLHDHPHVHTHIRAVRDGQEVLRYVAGYASKILPTNITRSPDVLAEAVLALHHVRICTTFGSWRGKRLLKQRPASGTNWILVASLDQAESLANGGDHYYRRLLDRLADASEYAREDLELTHVPSTPRAPPVIPKTDFPAITSTQCRLGFATGDTTMSLAHA